jgi:hypothetical protein
VTDAIGPRNVRQCLAGIAPGNGLAPLMQCQLGRAPHVNAFSLCPSTWVYVTWYVWISVLVSVMAYAIVIATLLQ